MKTPLSGRHGESLESIAATRAASGSDGLNSLSHRLARDLDRHFDEVVLAFQQPLFAFAFSMLGHGPDAEEVVQDVFVRAYRALIGYEPERVRSMAVQAWLYRICVNQARNKRRRKELPTTDLEADDIDASSSNPVVEGFERSERNAELRTMIGRLPGPLRTAIVLRFVNGLTYREIGEALEQPEGTVKSNVHRALKVLRHHYRDLPAGSDAEPDRAINRGSSQQGQPLGVRA